MVFGRSLAFSGMLPVSLWDTLIVAAAQLSECRHLFSQNSPLPLPPKPAIQKTGIQALYLAIYLSSFAYSQYQDF
jgi:hypothetical protein